MVARSGPRRVPLRARSTSSGRHIMGCPWTGDVPPPTVGRRDVPWARGRLGGARAGGVRLADGVCAGAQARSARGSASCCRSRLYRPTCAVGFAEHPLRITRSATPSLRWPNRSSTTRLGPMTWTAFSRAWRSSRLFGMLRLLRRPRFARQSWTVWPTPGVATRARDVSGAPADDREPEAAAVPGRPSVHRGDPRRSARWRAANARRAVRAYFDSEA